MRARIFISQGACMRARGQVNMLATPLDQLRGSRMGLRPPGGGSCVSVVS